MSFGTLQIEKMTTESGYSLGAGDSSAFKNKLINGAMAVNQYGSSAATIGTTNKNFAFDRFMVEQGGYSSNNGTVQQVSISNTFGFSNAGRVTAPTSSSGSTSAFIAFSQRIEGFNVQDLAYGTSAAKPVTLSFWVFTSLVGQYTVNLTHYNGTTERWSQNTYTVTNANTWQFVSITFSGDTSVDISNDNGANGWLRVYWNLGGGSAITGGSNPTNTWANATSYGGFRQQAGSVNFNNTSGATWQVTGCQLEVGTVATSFDFRSYGTEFMLCQRYLPAINYTGTGYIDMGYIQSSNSGNTLYHFQVPTRVAPTGISVTNIAGIGMTTVTNGGTWSSVLFNGATNTSAQWTTTFSASSWGCQINVPFFYNLNSSTSQIIF